MPDETKPEETKAAQLETVRCPHCHKDVVLAESLYPKNIYCPECGTTYEPPDTGYYSSNNVAYNRLLRERDDRTAKSLAEMGTAGAIAGLALTVGRLIASVFPKGKKKS